MKYLTLIIVLLPLSIFSQTLIPHQSCYWNLSIGTSPYMFRGNMGGCQLGAAATGVRCTGPGCSEVSFQCCKLGTKIAEEWGEWFSSAGWERNDNIDQGFAELIQCQGEKCSMMRIKYATYQGIVKSPRPQNGVPICYSPGDWISSQEPNNQQICYNNYYLTGLSCKGEFCDSLRITCCQAQKNN